MKRARPVPPFGSTADFCIRQENSVFVPEVPALPWCLPLWTVLATESPAGAPPSVQRLDALARARGIVAGNGLPLRFVCAGGSGLSPVARTWWLGEVEVRPGCWHDAFNALAWLTFPQLKSALNQGQHQAMAALSDAPTREESARVERVAACARACARFDTHGVVVASTQAQHGQIQAEHFDGRGNIGGRVFVLGHTLYDLLRHPQLRPCGAAMFLHVDEDWLQQPLAAQIAAVDALLARRYVGTLGMGMRTRWHRLRPWPLPDQAAVGGACRTAATAATAASPLRVAVKTM